AGEKDLVRAVAARDHRGRDQIGARALAGIDLGAQMDGLAARQALLPGVGARRRDHEGEGGMRRERVEMAPADEALVLAPPAGVLVLRPGDDAGGAEPPDRELLDHARLRGGEDEPATHLLAAI